MRGVIFGVGLLLLTNSQIWAQSITVFEGSGFRGQDRSFQGPVPRLGNQGWSDRIGSFVVGGGEWELCAEENFRDCVTVSVDQADLTQQPQASFHNSSRAEPRTWCSRFSTRRSSSGTSRTRTRSVRLKS